LKNVESKISGKNYQPKFKALEVSRIGYCFHNIFLLFFPLCHLNIANVEAECVIMT
jgi:hypothetical protein